MRTFFNTIENGFHDEATSHFLNSYFIGASFCFDMTVDCELFASVLHQFCILTLLFTRNEFLVTKQELFRFMKILCRWTKLITKLASFALVLHLFLLLFQSVARDILSPWWSSQQIVGKLDLELLSHLHSKCNMIPMNLSWQQNARYC